MEQTTTATAQRMQMHLIAMNAVRPGCLLVLFSLVAACASRTTPVQRTATPQRTLPVAAVAAPSNVASDDPTFGNAAPTKRKLLESALVSKTAGPCWNAPRHAAIIADMVAEDGTPYFMPHEIAIDLDGDGVKDPVVEVDRDGSTVRYELYVKRGTCAHHVGSVRTEGTILGPLNAVNGMRTLEIVGLCNDDQPCKDIEHTELFFDGKSWRAGKRWTTPTL